MSDPNDKSASILLKKQGKTEAIFLYDFAQFTGQNEDAGLYRAKINGCWHCPDGKYTALSADAVAALWAAFFIARRQRKHETKGEPYAL